MTGSVPDDDPPDWEDRMVAQMRARYPDAPARRAAWRARRRRRRRLVIAAIAVGAVLAGAIAHVAI